MKTKFDPLVQFHKQKMQLCEIQIIKLNNQITLIRSLVDSLTTQLTEIKTPKNAAFSEFLHTNELQKARIFEIRSLQSQTYALQEEINTFKEEYKRLYIEFEKVKHLQENEQEKILTFLKRKEQKDLDEVAILLYQKENL